MDGLDNERQNQKSSLSHQDIIRLDIGMDDAVRLEMLQTTKELRRENTNLRGVSKNRKVKG